MRAHLLLCMLAYWVQREMQRALAPLLFVDEAPPARPDPVAPAPRSETVLAKYRTQRTADGFPVHSFPTLLADLGTMVKNRVILTGVPEAPGFDQVTVPTQLQARALENSCSTSFRMAGFTSVSSSREARRSATAFRRVAWWWIR